MSVENIAQFYDGLVEGLDSEGLDAGRAFGKPVAGEGRPGLQAITEPPLFGERPQPAGAARPPPGASRRPPAAARRSRRGRAVSLPSGRASTARAWRERRAQRCS